MPTGVYLRKPCSEETKRKISVANKGKHKGIRISPRTEFKKGQIPWIKDRVHSDETRRKISIALTGKKFSDEHKAKLGRKGEKNNFWKGGISFQKDYDTIIYRRWRKTPRGRLCKKLHFHNRRLLLKGLSIKIVQQVYEDNIKVFGTLTCIYCFEAISFGKDVLEHIIPLSRGGTNERNSLDIACKSCNSSKGNKLIKEWFEERRGVSFKRR